MIRLLSAKASRTTVIAEIGGEVTAEEAIALKAAVDSAIEAAGSSGASLVLVIDEIPNLGNLGRTLA